MNPQPDAGASVYESLQAACLDTHTLELVGLLVADLNQHLSPAQQARVDALLPALIQVLVAEGFRVGFLRGVEPGAAMLTPPSRRTPEWVQ